MLRVSEKERTVQHVHKENFRICWPAWVNLEVVLGLATGRSGLLRV